MKSLPKSRTLLEYFFQTTAKWCSPAHLHNVKSWFMFTHRTGYYHKPNGQTRSFNQRSKRPRAPPCSSTDMKSWCLTVNISRFFFLNPASISHIWLYMILDDYTMIIIVLFRCPLYSPLLSHSYHIIIRLLFYYGIIIGLLLDEHLKKHI